MLNPADAAFVERLQHAVAGLRLRAPEPRYLSEPRGRMQGRAGVIALPGSVDEVAALVRFCAAERVGLVPYGGGTGLVGGQIFQDGPAPVIVSLERMAAVRALDPVGNVMVVEAGAVLADVQRAAQSVGRVFPLSLAAQGSAQLGGCLSTNAGGVNVLRYGNARDLCLGIEAVLPDGSVLRGLQGLRKDNTGYDVRGLLIGAEGTLGLITAAALRLFAPPAGVGTAMMVVGGPAHALALLELAEAQMGGGVLAFELIHRQGLLFVDETMPQLRQPFAERPEWMVLIDLGVPSGIDAQEALATLFEAGLSAGLVSEGVVAQNAQHREEMWALREALPEANRRIGSVSSHDISVPLAQLPAFISQAGQALARISDFRINCFGHVGDGNLHYNVFPAAGRARSEYEALRGAVKDLVHGLVTELGGSISAEHGIGRIKRDDLRRYVDPTKLAAMRAIKSALDPNGIMNPGAVIG